ARWGPSSAKRAAASSRTRPPPARSVPTRRSAGASSAPTAAAMPRWAEQVLLPIRWPLLSSVTSPCRLALMAVARPARPLPTTRSSVRSTGDVRPSPTLARVRVNSGDVPADQVAHFAGGVAHLPRGQALDVPGADGGHRLVDGLGRLGFAQGLQHHARRADGRQRVDHVLAGVLGRRTAEDRK